MIGTKLYKNNKTNMDNYFNTACWCNENNATIEDMGEYYEVVEVVIPEPSIADRIGACNNEYTQAKAEIANFYISAMLEGDTETQSELQEELAELKEAYNAQIDEILEGND